MDADKVDTSALLAVLVRTARRLKEQSPESTVGAPVIPERVPPLDTQFRPGVGVMLINGIGQVFVGKRIDMIEEAWQMHGGQESDAVRARAGRQKPDHRSFLGRPEVGGKAANGCDGASQRDGYADPDRLIVNPGRLVRRRDAHARRRQERSRRE